MAPIHGALHVALDLLEAAVEPELNGASDNPLVLAGDDAILSTGNFHTPAIALAADAHGDRDRPGRRRRPPSVSAASATPRSAGCPRTSPGGRPDRPAWRRCRSRRRRWSAAIRHAAAPLSIDPSVNAESVEDDATNAALAVLRLADQLDLLGRLIALELVCAAQAVDLAAPPVLGDGTADRPRPRARATSSRSTDDRPLGADIETVAAMIAMSGSSSPT